ncbi:unnamed protein product [Anisakis simplex]|uniref:Protein kinase domain-containing protein n=1 Tax=Anisakis simplex TaxID=6269 RepID=A0A0M3JH82_ANISI|nr:unnamed protein product [Anisakis simplex]
MTSAKLFTALQEQRNIRFITEELPAIGDCVTTELATYKLLKLIGKGGFGVVFESTNAKKFVFNE